MTKSFTPRSRRRSLTLTVFGAVASILVFAWGICTGRTMLPVRYLSLDFAEPNHQTLFWLTETFWLLLAMSAAFAAFEQVRRFQPTASAPAPASVPAKPVPANQFRPELRSTSPTGRYQINIYPVEMRMSHWIECPELLDTSTGQCLFLSKDNLWSLQSAVWQNDTLVSMQLMKYPDGQIRIEATIDCVTFTANIQGMTVEDSRDSAKVEQALNNAYETASRKSTA